ncbi:MAG: DUF2169 domain-containing protein [Proteobacteria bacterium]|nr:DUF2169 domain-containing protein [Pseudomonadota bacterium]
MLQVVNRTPFSASLSVFSDTDGVECAYAVVKATFTLTPAGPVLAGQQMPLVPTDVYWDEPDKTSLRAAGEFSLPKRATDVLLVGTALAGRKNIRVSEVGLRVGPLSKTLRVFGDRRWEHGGIGWEASPPEIWEQMPLRWELAFGGCALAANGELPEFEPRNPVGRGFVGRKESEFEGRLLPNIEDPASLIRKPTDRPQPACFAPIAPAWLPRRSFAGTYDEAWQKNRAPHLPLDFDLRFFQTAPQGLIAPGFLQGGEAVEFTGCSAEGSIRFMLPVCTVGLEFDFDGKQIPETPSLETVLIEPDGGRVLLLWRAGIKVDKRLLKLREVAVTCREYPLSPKES